MSAYHRHLVRTRRIQRGRWAVRDARAWRRWFASLGPRICECCGQRDTDVDWHDEIRGWAHAACVAREATQEAAEEGA